MNRERTNCHDELRKGEETFSDEYLLFHVGLPRLITAPAMVNLHASTRKELSVRVLSRCEKTSVAGQ